jgi:hypothetical protein
LADIKIAPVDPVSPDVAERFLLETPLQVKQTFTYTNIDIKSGMYLESGGKTYNIKGIAPYPDPTGGYIFYHLILEDVVSR